MARYTHFLTVALSAVPLQQQLMETLQACSLQIIFSSGDYLVAREPPSGIPFSKLVTVEVLIDKTRATETATQLNLVVKNEELPLQANNHCFRMYERVRQAFLENQNWHLVNSIAG